MELQSNARRFSACSGKSRTVRLVSIVVLVVAITTNKQPDKQYYSASNDSTSVFGMAMADLLIVYWRVVLAFGLVKMLYSIIIRFLRYMYGRCLCVKICAKNGV